MGGPGKIRRFFARLLFDSGMAGFAVVVLMSFNLWPEKLAVDPEPSIPQPHFVGDRLTLSYADLYPAAEVASYSHEFHAFLYFQFLRGRAASGGTRFFLIVVPTANGPSYRILMAGQNDLLTDIPRLGHLEGRRLIPHSEFTLLTGSRLLQYEHQSRVLETRLNRPTGVKLEDADPAELRSALTDFLLFKSETDNRVLEDPDPRPQPLTRGQAEEAAADILAVAYFYDLPLDYFLAVGAMENDYMDVNGDLTHTVWKRRPQSGDIVLLHRRKRVLVSDYSVGAWQITRETIRAAHELYLRDKRDYSLLPERLRPPRQLDLNNVSGPVLTTYAGLLLRDLLDHFHGDVQKAVGAYNGGTKTPNPHYASAVTRVAEYARRVLEAAPVLQSQGRKPVSAGNGSDGGETASVRPWRLHDP